MAALRSPTRTCVGCRARAAQAALVRFVRSGSSWSLDCGRVRAPGRGAYLCSRPCAVRARKNKRYPGLASAAEAAVWKGASALSVGTEDVYDKRVPSKRHVRGHGPWGPEQLHEIEEFPSAAAEAVSGL